MSRAGVLAYVPGSTGAGRDDVFLYDRTGGTTALKLPPGVYPYPRVSPEGKRIALETQRREAGGHLRLRSFGQELTAAPDLRREQSPANLVRDGKRLAFQSDRDGDRAIFWQAVDGGTAERLTRPEPGTSHVPESWSPREDVFLFSATTESTTTLWTFSLRDRKASRFSDVASRAFPTNAVFSPDGRWVAYQAGDQPLGEATTYIEPYPANGAKHEIARGGGRCIHGTARSCSSCPRQASSGFSRCARTRSSTLRRRSRFRAASGSRPRCTPTL